MQSTVNLEYAMGIVGELIQDGPQRVDSLIVNSSGAGNTIGYAFTKPIATNVAAVGGTESATVVFAGILVNPKVYSSAGTTSNPLAASMTIPDNSQGEFMKMGTIVVSLANACNPGDQVEYATATGVLSAVAPGAAADVGNTLIAGAYVLDTINAAAGIAKIRLTG